MNVAIVPQERKIGPIIETKAFEQLGIFLLDGSPSMLDEGETGQPKHLEVDQAVRGTIARLKVSRMKENFLLAMTSFASDVNPGRLPASRLLDIDETGNFDPLHPNGNATAMGDAIRAAGRQAEAFLAASSEVPRSVVIILMTDGQDNTGEDPIAVASEIKASGRRISICAAGYGRGGDVDELTLKKIVTDPAGYSRVYDAEQLRKFFERSVSSVVI